MKRKKPYQDLTGKRYGRLLVLSLVDDEAGEKIPTRWLCQCDCGKKLEIRAYNLKSGNTLSCGCLQREKAATQHLIHGETGSRLYVAWAHMRQRCSNLNDSNYRNYGGRGITVCEEWQNSFEAFHDWAMANGYTDELTIDRIDVNGNYEPSNCRWITLSEQQRNKRNNVRVSFNGEVKTVGEWAKEFKCFSGAVYREILKREGRLYSEDY